MAYAKSSPPPCVHPIIQLITREWRDAKDDERDPDWSVMSDAHIKESCEEVAAANPTWHKDLFVVYLDLYIAGLTQNTLLGSPKRRGGGCFLVLSLLQCRQVRMVCAGVSLGLY